MGYSLLASMFPKIEVTAMLGLRMSKRKIIHSSLLLKTISKDNANRIKEIFMMIKSEFEFD